MAINNRNIRNYNNSTHVGDVSFTEDKILIYKIYVSNIPAKVNKEELAQYFENFGSILHCNIFKMVDGKKHYKFGFVNFERPESASTALLQYHTIKNRRLNVLCADSWKQPHRNNLLISTNNDDNSSNDSTISILNLNDDCLFLILEYLEFHEHICLSTLCLRFQNLFKQMYQFRKSLKIDPKYPLTLMNFRDGLQQVGQHIEKIKISLGSPKFTRFISLVSKLCPNLQNLHLNSFDFKYVNIFHKISYKLKNIKQLELKNCSFNDEMIKLLATLPIEDLDLTQNSDITGKYLHKFKNLKRLILDTCENIRSTNFTQMCQKIVDVKELNIRLCKCLNLPAFESMITNLNELEMLTISTKYETSQFYVITKLKSLKYLTVNGSIFGTEMLFTRLATDKADQIEIIKILSLMNNYDLEIGKSLAKLKQLKQIHLQFSTRISGEFFTQLTKLSELKMLSIPGCRLFDTYAMLNFIKVSKRIEFIDVSKCNQLNDEFIFEIIKILKEKNCIKPLTLRIGSNGIKPSIKEDPSFMNGCELITLDFNTTDPKLSVLNLERFIV